MAIGNDVMEESKYGGRARGENIQEFPVDGG